MKQDAAKNGSGKPEPIPREREDAPERLVRYAAAEKPSPAASKCPDQLLSAGALTRFGVSILTAAGATDEEARTVTVELVAADLAGHPSHGVMRLIQYVRLMDTEYINSGASLEVVQESPVVSVYDGHFGFGQCIMRELLATASRHARKRGTYTAFCRNCAHIGRLGSYTRDAARDGFLAMMMVNVNGACRVAPFGSIDARMGTNPISMAAPWGDDAIYVDTTSCNMAEGKVRLAVQNGEELPEGMLIDNQGQPTTDPNRYYTDPPGAILPLGGPLGYKGSGLAVMIDIVGGILSGAGFGRSDVAIGTNGIWLYLVDLVRVVDLEFYQVEIERFIAYLKDVRTAPGVDTVLVPGEPEQLRTATAEAEGIRIPGGTWYQLAQLAEGLGVELP